LLVATARFPVDIRAAVGAADATEILSYARSGQALGLLSRRLKETF